MEFQDLVRTRRSVRGYKPDPVPRHIIEEVIATAADVPGASLPPHAAISSAPAAMAAIVLLVLIVSAPLSLHPLGEP